VLIAVILASAVVTTAAVEFEAQTIDLQSAVGRIARLNAKEVVLETADGPKTFALSALQGLTRQPAAPAGERKTSVSVELVDQSTLAGTAYTVRDGHAELTLPSGTRLELPTKVIKWVRFGPAAGGDAKVAKQWSEIAKTKATGDLLVIRKGGALDYLEGVQLDIDEETFRFELDKEVVPVKRSKVEGVVYFHATEAEMPEAVGYVTTVPGDRVAVRAADFAGDSLKIGTLAGMSLEIPLSEIARFDLSTGKIAYLSDLEAESATHVPFLGFSEEPQAFGEFYRYRRDAGFENKPLKLDGKIYRKGLSLASRGTLVYKLPGKFRLFKTVIGIDDSVRETGDVKVAIKGDGKVLWQGEVRGGRPPEELELKIVGIKRLEIVVDYGADLDIGDRLDLADARITK
jgi:hypothetical protein